MIKNPKFKLKDTVADLSQTNVSGWVASIFKPYEGQGEGFVYGVQDAEDDHIYFFHESELIGV